MAKIKLSLRKLNVFAKGRPILREVSFEILENEVFGILGPSGVGKSTLLKCLNRLIDLNPDYRVTGDVLFQDRPIFSPEVDADELRTRIGILFQQPVVFPKSIGQNVLFGLKHHRKLSRSDRAARVERVLKETALWNEVKDRLHESARKLSVGQQQRLCLARALALDPEIILMDEPTSALDAKSTEAIEELILRLKADRTLVLVTHDLDQARRVTDRLVCLSVIDGVGEITGCGPCSEILCNSREDGSTSKSCN